jgi:hypothetical protein
MLLLIRNGMAKLKVDVAMDIEGMMNLQEIRNQMWVIVNDKPLRLAKDVEVKRWAALRIIETLQSDSVLIQNSAKTATA